LREGGRGWGLLENGVHQQTPAPGPLFQSPLTPRAVLDSRTVCEPPTAARPLCVSGQRGRLQEGGVREERGAVGGVRVWMYPLSGNHPQLPAPSCAAPKQWTCQIGQVVDCGCAWGLRRQGAAGCMLLSRAGGGGVVGCVWVGGGGCGIHPAIWWWCVCVFPGGRRVEHKPVADATSYHAWALTDIVCVCVGGGGGKGAVGPSW